MVGLERLGLRFSVWDTFLWITASVSPPPLLSLFYSLCFKPNLEAADGFNSMGSENSCYDEM